MGKYIFVIGAGASIDFDLPLGDELKEDISRSLKEGLEKGSPLIDAIYHYWQNETDKGLDFETIAHKVANNMSGSESIDSYIEDNKSNVFIQKIGKLSIVNQILVSERNSTLFIDKQKNVYDPIFQKDISKSWLEEFWRVFISGKGYENVNSLKSFFNEIVFITFNYDRCIEQYFYHKIKQYYGYETYELSQVMKSIQIIHVYGSLGSMDWEEGSTVQYGAEATKDNLESISNSIKTFTEAHSINDAVYINMIDSMISARSICFLGFGYNYLNMKILNVFNRIRDDSKCKAECFGTYYKAPEPLKPLIKSDINTKLCLEGESQIKLDNLIVSEFIRTYYELIMPVR